MARWEAGTGSRIQAAAFELFAEHGFAGSTAAAIAERAGVTERTFFRYFSSKEELLFADGDAILTELLSAIDEAPLTTDAMGLINAAIDRICSLFESDRAAHRVRFEVIASDQSLIERELLKQSIWTSHLAGAMAKRRVPPGHARLLAAVAIAAFRVTYEAWLTDRRRTPLADRVHEALRTLAQELQQTRS